MVQSYWNELENQLIADIDKLVPPATYTNSNIKAPIPQSMKHRLNERKILLKSNKRLTRNEKIERINNCCCKPITHSYEMEITSNQSNQYENTK